MIFYIFLPSCTIACLPENYNFTSPAEQNNTMDFAELHIGVIEK
jgi:hypothetical protein